VDLHEGCDVGRAGGDEARKLTGRLKGTSLVNNLPYVLDQSALQASHRLPVLKCRSFLPVEREGGGGAEPQGGGKRGGNNID
jgi:hypothetical protein